MVRGSGEGGGCGEGLGKWGYQLKLRIPNNRVKSAGGYYS